MVKIRTWTDPWIDPMFAVLIYHFGPSEPWDPLAVHSVYAYPISSFPSGPSGYYLQFDLDNALVCAKTFAAMPQIPRDLCIECRNHAYGPQLPRWNIYRGENLMHTPPCIFWDAGEGPPPWP
jgi:hypothetical protein